MALVLRLPYRSIWAPPMKPTSRKPRWARRKVSVIAGSIWARWAARISLVEMGSEPGFHLGPTMPPSMTMVRRGACMRWARPEASMGAPTPAKTVVLSSSSRAPITASSSLEVTPWGPPFTTRAPGRAAPIDAVDIGGEVVGLGVVEAVALVGIGAIRHVHERVHREAGDDGAIGMEADLLLGDDLFRGDEHGRRGPRDVGIHVRIAVDLAVPEAIGAMHMEERHVGKERGHGQELLPRVGAVDDLRAAHVHQARAHHGQGGQKGHAHGRRAEPEPERQVAPLFHGYAPRLDVLAVDFRQPPRQADAHPRRDDLVHRTRDHAPLALVAHQVA